ncbi:hypothetical protein CISIN_1g0246512mg, partial [Citrus sinensis]
MAGVAGILFTD